MPQKWQGRFATRSRPENLEQGERFPNKRVPKYSDSKSDAEHAKRRHELAQQLRKYDQGVKAYADFRRSDEEIKKIKNKKVRAFHRDQNCRISDWLEVDAIVSEVADDVLYSFENSPSADNHGPLDATKGAIDPFLPDDERERRAKEHKSANRAININVAANVLLLGAKAIASLKSNSLSLIASLVDSALDLLCTIIIFGTSRVVSWRSDKLNNRYPAGRRRLEPLGIVVFSILMVVSFLQILQESIQTLTGNERVIPDLTPVAIGGMLGTIIVKGLIWFICAWQASGQVQALAQDCKTDVVFNTFSLLFPAVGLLAKVWWLDSAGAGLLSIFIIFDWARTCLKNIDRLTGAAVDSRTEQKMLFLAWRFSSCVGAYKNLKAYHSGDGVWVECDILLDPSTKLQVAHDIAETMQYCYESLAEVDRAFVSVDYAQKGPQGHVLSPTNP